METGLKVLVTSECGMSHFGRCRYAIASNSQLGYRSCSQVLLGYPDSSHALRTSQCLHTSRSLGCMPSRSLTEAMLGHLCHATGYAMRTASAIAWTMPPIAVGVWVRRRSWVGSRMRGCSFLPSPPSRAIRSMQRRGWFLLPSSRVSTQNHVDHFRWNADRQDRDLA